MANLGDYVQHRDGLFRGEVVHKNKDGWCMVQFRDDKWTELHEKHLIVLVKGKNG